MAMKMPKVSECEQEACSYNQKKACHAMAITVGEEGSLHPMCDTAVVASKKGGGATDGAVGACKEEDCKFNKSLECTAKSIQVAIHSGASDCADCKTYAPR